MHAVHLACRQLRAGCLRDALLSARQALQSAPRDFQVLNTLGAVFSACADHDIALKLFRDAASLAPADARVLLNLSMELRFTGELEAAERWADRALEIDPMDCEGQLYRSTLRRQTRERCHISLLERLLAGGVDTWRGEVQLRYALAKEYEDIADYAASFRHLSAGADLRRRNTRYDVATDLAIMEQIERVFAAPPVGVAGCENSEPIFIVGLPRTGTTLLERILSSHTEVSSAGELQDFGAQLVQMVHGSTNGAKLGRADFVRAAGAIDFAGLGLRYIEATRYVTGRTGRFIDKLPGNFLYIGLIRRALPNAKIIHVTRQPLDTAYSIYKTLFKHAYPYSYDLTDLARYYVGYRRLMDHWHRQFPETVLDVSYEALVDDQRAQTRRVLEFCGLEWQARVLDFHRNAHACTTASASQIREPLYRTSVAQWRHFERELAPFRSMVESAGLLS